MADRKETLKVKPLRMSDADFKAASEAYERGLAGITELSRTYGVSRTALYKRFERNGIVKSSKLGQAPSAPPPPPIETFSSKRTDFIEQTRMEGYQALRQAQLVARKIVADALKAGKALSTVDDDLRAAGRLNKIVCDNVMTTLELLESKNHIDEDDLPTLTIEDLTQQEIEEHHRRTGALQDGEDMSALDEDDEDD